MGMLRIVKAFYIGTNEGGDARKIFRKRVSARSIVAFCREMSKRPTIHSCATRSWLRQFRNHPVGEIVEAFANRILVETRGRDHHALHTHVLVTLDDVGIRLGA